MSSPLKPGATHQRRIDPREQLLAALVASAERNRSAPLTMGRTAANIHATTDELWSLIAEHDPPKVGIIHLRKWGGEPVVLVVPIDMEPEE